MRHSCGGKFCGHFVLPPATLILLLALSLPTQVHGQANIPIGTWRLHLSYNSIRHVAEATNKVFGSTGSGILVLDREDNSISSYNSLNGLSSTGITYIAYDQGSSQLIVTYADGNIDLIKEDKVINFDRIKNSTDITGSKKINHVSIRNNLAYMASDYGVVVFDLQQNELKETWRGLAAEGGLLKIYQSALVGDSIFLATEKGMLAGNLKANLLDFKNWKRFSTGDFAGAIHLVIPFNNKLYAAVNGIGMYEYNNGSWLKQSYLTGSQFTSMTSSSANLFVAEGNNLWAINSSGAINSITDALISTPMDVRIDDAGKLFIGDAVHGLVSDLSGSYVSYLPNGPTRSSAFRLKYIDKKVYALPSSPSDPFSLDGNNTVDFFSEGAWHTFSSSLTNITDVEFTRNQTYLSSFGDGVEQVDITDSRTIYNDQNSSLRNINPSEKSINITSMSSSGNDLYVVNYGAVAPLHKFDGNTWQSYSLNNIPSARYASALAMDFSGNLWMTIDPAFGGGIFVQQSSDGNILYKTTAAGSGALPASAVRSIAVDRDGYVWIGTTEGVAYFYSSVADAVKPIFENRFLLRDEIITSIAVDGGNRKWIGTTRGAWLVSPTGETLIHNFTVENSPLLSNNIRDIGINQETGEVFFSTDKGIISYRGDATESEATFASVKIFPNPVTASFAGTVGISGLASDAIVKITDINGKLIWQTQANGGTAVWNVRDSNGRRASTGVYIIFAATADGAESAVGKIAVID